MQLVKLSVEDLNSVCSQLTLQRAESYVGNFYDCNLNDLTLSGTIRGNHGEYNVSISVENGTVTQHSCICETSQTEFCKHAAALGLTYIYTPWLFNGKRMKRSNIKTSDDLKYYLSTTPLKEMIIALKSKGISLAMLSDILKISSVQLSGIIKDDQVGKTHQITEPIKLACVCLLDKPLDA